MKAPSPRFRPLATAIACALFASLLSSLHAQTATTTPVGFITVTVPAAVNASTPTNRTISIPLYGTADFVSTVASLDSTNQFTMTGAAWTAGAYAQTTAPRLVRVKTSTTAAHIGRFFLVSGNTANQLTVALPPGVSNINSGISAGDSCEIVPANTLGSVFGTTANPPKLTGGATPDVADNVYIWSGTGWDPYYWTGAIWKKTGNIDRKDTVLYPDEAVFVIRRDTTSAAAITLMGTVPSTAESTQIAASGSTFVANRFPVDMTLGTVSSPTMPALNLQNIPGWVGGATPDVADSVYIWSGTGWDPYFWTGTIWKKTGNVDRSSTVIPAGTGVFVTHSGAALTLAQGLPYTP